MSQAGFDVQEATIDGIHAAMQSGALTCRALVEEYLRRIEAYDRRGPNLNAIQSLNSRALDEADALDAELRRSGPRGPLHGIPVAIKDQVEVLGMPTTYGSALFRGFVPKRDATVVQRIKAAGGIVLAKTNMGEFAAGYAGSAYGVCRNPYDPARDPSGSSSGSGVAVSANMAAVAVGEDTFGSVRGPAARNCIVGLRPTLPLVSRFGMMPATPTRDTLGPLARTVRDAALLLDVMAGYDPNDPITASSVGHVPATYTSFLTRGALPDVRVGVIRDALATDTDPQAEDYQRIRDVIDRALRDLAGLGVDVVDPLAIPGILDLMADMEGTFESEEATNAYLAAHPDAPARTLRDIVLSPQVLPYRRARLVEGLGRTTNDPGYLRQMQARAALRQAVFVAMADANVDILIYATFDHDPLPIPPDILTTTHNPPQPGNNRRLSPLIGFPALSVPAGFSPNGLPVGLELLGRPFAEGALFRIAFAYEQATSHRRPPPTTPPLHMTPDPSVTISPIA